MTLFLDHDLAQRLERDLQKGNFEVLTAWRTVSTNNCVEELVLDGALGIYGGPDSPMNEVVGLGMSGPIDAGVLDKIEYFFKSFNHPSVIRVCPLAHPSLMDTLRDRGYGLAGFTYRWVLDLSSWESPFPEEDARVRAADVEEETDFAQAVARGFLNTDDILPENQLELERAFFRMRSGAPVVALENEQVIAGGMIAVNDGIAGLFSASTLPSFRKRGLQTALLDWRLRYAQKQGAWLATIETDPGSDSQRNVERFGFRLAYANAQLKKQFTDSM